MTLLQQANPQRLIPDEVEAILPYKSLGDLSPTYTTGKTLLFEKGIMVMIPLHRKTNIPHLVSHVKRMDPSALHCQTVKEKRKRGESTLSLINANQLVALTGYEPGEISPFLIHQPLQDQSFTLSHIIIDDRVVGRNQQLLSQSYHHTVGRNTLPTNTTFSGVLQKLQMVTEKPKETPLKEESSIRHVVIGSGNSDDAFVIPLDTLLPGLAKRYPEVPISILDITSPESPSIEVHIYLPHQAYHISLPEKHTFEFVLTLLSIRLDEAIYDHLTRIDDMTTPLINHVQQYKSTRNTFSTRKCLILHTEGLHAMVESFNTFKNQGSMTLSPSSPSCYALFSRYAQFNNLYWRSLDDEQVLLEPYVRFNLMDIPHGLTEVIPHFLYLGSMNDFNDVSSKFHHVICLASNSSYLESASYHYFQMRDTRTENLKDMVEKVLPLLEKIRKAKQTVFLHSVKGMSRSVAIIMAYLMKYRQLSAEDAYILLKRKRHFVLPNAGFVKQLQQLELQWQVHPTISLDHLPTESLPLIYQSSTKLAPFTWTSSLAIQWRGYRHSTTSNKHPQEKKKKVKHLSNDMFMTQCHALCQDASIFKNIKSTKFHVFCSHHRLTLEKLFAQVECLEGVTLKKQSSFSKVVFSHFRENLNK